MIVLCRLMTPQRRCWAIQMIPANSRRRYAGCTILRISCRVSTSLRRHISRTLESRHFDGCVPSRKSQEARKSEENGSMHNTSRSVRAVGGMQLHGPNSSLHRRRLAERGQHHHREEGRARYEGGERVVTVLPILLLEDARRLARPNF